MGVSLFGAHGQNSASIIPFLIGPLLMVVIGFFVMKKLIFDLVDEVWDDGNSLLVKNRGQEQRIPLSDIRNVSYSPYMNPPRVTLSLRRPTVFGDQITFSAPLRFVPFATSPVIDDLINRIDTARQQRM
ncbi:MAG TPA: hypothetical protein VHW95_03920 [Steroidobacteraceae bacterium]|nr:hypothetical protein [Steroidobacteraceae bacterium]